MTETYCSSLQDKPENYGKGALQANQFEVNILKIAAKKNHISMQVCSTATVNKPTEIQTELDKHENNLITDDDNDFSLMETNEKYPQPH